MQNLRDCGRDKPVPPELRAKFARLWAALRRGRCFARASKVSTGLIWTGFLTQWLENAAFADKVVKEINSENIPIRVTHNDTKINNILFDKISGEAVCVIDLDTVMPGSMLYDFGDALRMGGSTAAEDETDISKVHFDKECFTAFAKGFLSEVKDIITPAEKELFAFSVKLMTYECGIRFLTDYLNGDTYFKIHRENHNLDRARNQFALVDELNRIEPELNSIIKELS